MTTTTQYRNAKESIATAMEQVKLLEQGLTGVGMTTATRHVHNSYINLQHALSVVITALMAPVPEQPKPAPETPTSAPVQQTPVDVTKMDMAALTALATKLGVRIRQGVGRTGLAKDIVKHMATETQVTVPHTDDVDMQPARQAILKPLMAAETAPATVVPAPKEETKTVTTVAGNTVELATPPAPVAKNGDTLDVRKLNRRQLVEWLMKNGHSAESLVSLDRPEMVKLANAKVNADKKSAAVNVSKADVSKMTVAQLRAHLTTVIDRADEATLRAFAGLIA